MTKQNFNSKSLYEDGSALYNDLRPYLNENRMKFVLSKLDEDSHNNLRIVSDLVAQDAISEYKKDNKIIIETELFDIVKKLIYSQSFELVKEMSYRDED